MSKRQYGFGMGVRLPGVAGGWRQNRTWRELCGYGLDNDVVVVLVRPVEHVERELSPSVEEPPWGFPPS